MTVTPQPKTGGNMRHTGQMVVFGAGLVAVALACGGGAAAAALDVTDISSADEAAKLLSAHDDVISDSATDVTLDESDQAWSSTANEVAIDLPVDPTESISVSSPTGTMDIGLPSATSAEDAHLTSAGLIAYDNNDGSYSVPIPGENGELQINTLIDSAAAPRSYSYALGLPAEARLEQIGEALFFFGEADEMLLMVGAPWAKDSEGLDVPTRYEYADGTLTQFVEHGAETSYPVVADPWFGWTLFHRYSSGVHLGQKKYSAWPTPAAFLELQPFRLTGNPPRATGITGTHKQWVDVMGTAGWAEWKKAWPDITNKPSLRQQFMCHVSAGALGVFATHSYDLERSRPNRTNGNWQTGVVFHQCNWANATGTAKN